MYKVFFVDDEAAMRAGIRESIDWEGKGFTLAGEAPDGEMALSLMQDIMPDILITDVRMPFMDGIELARHTRKTMPWIKIIILSGHDEFEYAKQAITIGVEDYLLKPVTSGMLIETLNEIVVKIEEEKEKLRNVEELIAGSKTVRAEKLVSDLLYGGIGEEEALALAEELGLPVVSDCYLVMHIELYLASDKSYNVYFQARDCAFGVLGGWENAIFFSQGSDRVVCVLKGTDAAALEEDAYTCGQAVKYEVERNGSCSVAVAIGSVVTDIKDWPRSLADADAVKRYLHMTGRKQIMGAQDISAGSASADSKYNDVIARAQEYIRNNYFEQDISLHSVAKEVSISPNHFSTIFRQETGETFINYLTRIRLEHAKALLTTTTMRTSEVGYEVGYNDTHYFSYVFKKNNKMTPKEFRTSLTS